MSDLSGEAICRILRDFSTLSYVRQLTGWNFNGEPTPRSLPGCEILAYTLQAYSGKVSRVFYILANETDGLAMPVADNYGGMPIVPRSIACRESPILYEAELERERQARREHVDYWRELEVKPAPPPEPPRSVWQRITGR